MTKSSGVTKVSSRRSCAIGLILKSLVHIDKRTCGYLSGSVCRANSGSSHWNARCRSVHAHRKDRCLALGLFHIPYAQRFLWSKWENGQTTTSTEKHKQNKQPIQVQRALTSLTWCASCGGRQLGQDVPPQQFTLGLMLLKWTEGISALFTRKVCNMAATQTLF